MKREDAERLVVAALDRAAETGNMTNDTVIAEFAAAILAAVAEERERCERIARRYDAEAWGHSNRSVAFNVAQNIADIIAGRLPDRQPEEPAPMSDPAAKVRRDWCEEHNRGSLAKTDGLCPECEAREEQRAERGAETMTDPAANPEPGFYVAYDKGNKTQLLWRSSEALWSGRNPEWPDMARPTLPPGWTLGPSIAELLRDAARLDWLARQTVGITDTVPEGVITPDGKLKSFVMIYGWKAGMSTIEVRAEIARERKAEGG